ncbi:MAG: Hpt domain-containing protein, partial [Cyanobacteria bacterium REEB65]|nr:Hpt domain-containing protein [Cyanobacteria bacterium REEB65]
MDTSQYVGVFVEESREILQRLNDKLLVLEKQRDDRQALDEIFRHSHTLKGMSATLGFARLAELTHHMENLLDALRSGTMSADGPLVDTLFGCLDMIGASLDAISKGQPEPDISAILGRLEAHRKLGASAETGAREPLVTAALSGWPALDDYEKAIISEAESFGFRSVWVRVKRSSECILKGVRAYMAVSALEGLGEL